MRIKIITVAEVSKWKPDVQVEAGYNKDNGLFEWLGTD
jgi:hypothetical protein